MFARRFIYLSAFVTVVVVVVFAIAFVFLCRFSRARIIYSVARPICRLFARVYLVLSLLLLLLLVLVLVLRNVCQTNTTLDSRIWHKNIRYS